MIVGRVARVLAVVMAAAAAACTSDGPAGPQPPASALRYTELSAGYYHTCALTFSGSVFCWGGNDSGTLGDGTRTTRMVPTAVAGARRFVSLDAGAGHNCALTETGAAWCWGQNDEGQAGDGTFTPRSAPVVVTGGLTFVQISAGHAHSCAVTADGRSYCWGDDSRGQLGNGPSGVGRSAQPVQVLHEVPFARVFAGYYQTCALTASGEAFCWGANESGQGGNGHTDDSDVPLHVSGGLRFTDLAPGDRFVCGVSAGATWCWGANRHSELGPAAPPGGSPVPLRLTAAPAAVLATTSMGTSTIGAEPYGCLATARGSAHCWGGAVRALRPGDAGIAALDDRIRFLELTAGAQHICGLSREGYAYCGGGNYAGQLGDATQNDRSLLIAVH